MALEKRLWNSIPFAPQAVFSGFFSGNAASCGYLSKIRTCVVFCLCALLCALSAHVFAGTPGFSGEWIYYGDQDAELRIDEESGLLEDGTTRTRYVLLEEQGAGRCRAARKVGSRPGEVRKICRMHADVLLFLGVKNPILVRKGARFKAPREKIRGRWRYAAQTNEAFYYNAEFDLDARKMVEILRSENGGYTRGEGRPLEMLLDAQAELALQAGDAVYHFARLGADFLVLEGKYAASTLNGYKILMEQVRAPRAEGEAKAEKTRQTDGRRVAAAQAHTKSGPEKASKTKSKKKSQF